MHYQVKSNIQNWRLFIQIFVATAIIYFCSNPEQQGCHLCHQGNLHAINASAPKAINFILEPGIQDIRPKILIFPDPNFWPSEHSVLVRVLRNFSGKDKTRTRLLVKSRSPSLSASLQCHELFSY